MKTKFNRTLAVLTAAIMLICTMSFGIITAEGGDIPIDSEHFPDANFRNFVLTGKDNETNVKIDTDGNGSLSPEEIAAVTNIGVSSKEIADLTGIEYFTALTELRCYLNKLTSLDVSKNTALTDLDCGNNKLTQLDVSQNTVLTKLYCMYNQLTELDVSQNTALEKLNCENNLLTSLDVSKNTVLEYLRCSDNQLTSLDVSQNTALTELGCSENQLTSLDVSNNTALMELGCSGNQLTSLDLSANTNLEDFNCRRNKYRISSDPFDLTALPGNFDVAKASNWHGGTVESNILTFNPDEAEVTYTYYCGNNFYAVFALLAPRSGVIQGFYFETQAQVDEWTCIDNDGDGFNWIWSLDPGAPYTIAPEGEGCMVSCSYVVPSQPLTPDNWLISPVVMGGGSVSFLTQASGQYCHEPIGVYVTTDGGLTLSNELAYFVPEDGAVNFCEVRLAAFAGQEIQVVFRHYDVSDQMRINLDAVEVSGSEPEPTPETVPGDYDCNGEVNVQDAILTLRAAMNLITPSAQSLLNADMDGDGTLAVTDAITILRMAMNLI